VDGADAREADPSEGLQDMRGAGIQAYGGAVQLLELPATEISDPRQLLIAVHAAGVANWDDFVRTGRWDVGATPPMALGVEAAGVVRAVGAAVARFRVGDEVLTHSVPLPQGAWAELLAVPEDHAARQPAGMSVPVAGLLPVPVLTAAQVLAEAVALQRGERVLIHGAGGITGGVLVAVAADMGGWVIATAGPASAARVRRYGAHVVLDYHQPDWPSEVRRLTGEGVPVAVNAVPGAAAGLLPLVVNGGRLATITIDPPPGERGIQVSNVYVRPDGRLLEQLAARFAQRALALPVAGVHGLADAGRALADVVAGRAAGGVVLDPRR
jgi:NADPH:quinone reductase-like Zn-dependent oxidoreductase